MSRNEDHEPHRPLVPMPERPLAGGESDDDLWGELLEDDEPPMAQAEAARA